MLADDHELGEMVAEAEIQLCLAEEIYVHRTALGLTQTQLAKRIGTTQSVIARMEDADYDGHSLKMMQRIARALGLRFSAGFFAKRLCPAKVYLTQEIPDNAAWTVVVPTSVD